MPPAHARDSTLKDSLQRLRGSQKPAHGTPAYSRFVNRPLGRYFAALAHQCGLSPNQISLISAFFTFSGIGIIAAAPPSAVLSLTVAVLLVLGYALDSADGQVSRLQGSSSRFGEWLDHMIDCLKVATLHLVVLVHMYRYFDHSTARLLLPLCYTAVAFVMYFGLMLTDQLRRAAYAGSRPAQGSLSLVRAVLILPTDYGVLALVMGLIAWQRLFTGLYAVMLAGATVFLVAALIKWGRAMAALDRSAGATLAEQNAAPARVLAPLARPAGYPAS